jgi:hypothetical protein
MAVPIAEPESLATGGTNASQNNPDSFHLVFQSQLSPHPPRYQQRCSSFQIRLSEPIKAVEQTVTEDTSKVTKFLIFQSYIVVTQIF